MSTKLPGFTETELCVLAHSWCRQDTWPSGYVVFEVVEKTF